MRVRRDAAGALARCPGPGAARILLEALAAEDGNDDRLPWHGPAGPTEAQKGELAELRRVNAGSVREVEVSSLRLAAGAEAPRLLRELLAHDDPAVRSAAAVNLLTLADPGAAAAVAARIPGEKEAGIRRRLLGTLAALGGAGADAAFESLLSGEDPDLRVAALEALAGEEAKARAPEGTRLCLGRPDAAFEERIAATLALGRAGGPGAAALLAEILAKASTGEELRASLQALARTRDPAAVPAVAALLPGGGAAGMPADARETADLAVETLGDLRAPEGAPPPHAFVRPPRRQPAPPAAPLPAHGHELFSHRQRLRAESRSLARLRSPPYP